MSGKKPAPSAEHSARAPDLPPPAPPVALRVRAIRLQLDAGTWGPGCAAELAAAWGVTEVVVRAHAAEAQRQREAMSLALYQIGRQPAELLARGRLRVTFTRLASGTLDDDNLAGAFKACRDAVAAWLGVDDGPRGPVTWAYTQEPHKRHRNAPMVRISFEEPAPRRTG